MVSASCAGSGASEGCAGDIDVLVVSGERSREKEDARVEQSCVVRRRRAEGGAVAFLFPLRSASPRVPTLLWLPF
jgi:hypothetical protein